MSTSKPIILGSLIGKVAVLAVAEMSYHTFAAFPRLCLRTLPCLSRDLPVHLILGLLRSGFPARMTPPSLVLKGLPSLPFTVPKPSHFSSRLRLHQLCLSRAAEYLLKIQILALVHHINESHLDGYRRILLHNGCQVCRIIQERHRLISKSYRAEPPWYLYPSFTSTTKRSLVTDVRIAFFLHVLHHFRNQLHAHLTLALPEVKCPHSGF